MRELQQGLNRAPGTLESETRKAMTTGLLLLEAEQKRNAPRDTGRLQGSIHHTITGGGANLTGRVGPAARYAYWVEHGRRPGRYPPIDAVAGWARRHGIHPFVLARAIARRGTRAQPFVAPSLQKHRTAILRLFDKIGAKVAVTIASGR